MYSCGIKYIQRLYEKSPLFIPKTFLVSPTDSLNVKQLCCLILFFQPLVPSTLCLYGFALSISAVYTICPPVYYFHRIIFSRSSPIVPHVKIPFLLKAEYFVCIYLILFIHLLMNIGLFSYTFG